MSDVLLRILGDVSPLPDEEVSLLSAVGRVLTESVVALCSHPPFDSSSMDGYAICASDGVLSVIGESAAGCGFSGEVGSGEAVRIFTGAPMPRGADRVVIQENTRAGDGQVEVLSGVASGAHVRVRGLDFSAGDVLLEPGRRLTPADISLAAAANRSHLRVHRRARVAILASGSELVPAGTADAGEAIIASGGAGLGALVGCHGGVAIDSGIAADTLAETSAALERALAVSPDVLITVGGASSGDYDLIPAALRAAGAASHFQGIAMRPGKPLAWARRGETGILVLPGNPVSAHVCACIFLVPLLDRLHGGPGSGLPTRRARLEGSLAANDARRDYLRVSLREDAGVLTARPFSRQDSSMLSVLSRADGLAVREAHAGAAQSGDLIEVIPLLFSGFSPPGAGREPC